MKVTKITTNIESPASEPMSEIEKQIRMNAQREAEELAFKASEVERIKVFKDPVHIKNMKKITMQRAEMIAGDIKSEFYKTIYNSLIKKVMQSELKIAEGKSWIAAGIIYKRTLRREFKKILEKRYQNKVGN